MKTSKKYISSNSPIHFETPMQMVVSSRALLPLYLHTVSAVWLTIFPLESVVVQVYLVQLIVLNNKTNGL